MFNVKCLLLAGYFYLFGPFSVNTKDGCVGKSQKIARNSPSDKFSVTFHPNSDAQV